jgi:hypothetical protein
VIIILGVVGFAAYYVYHRQNRASNVASDTKTTSSSTATSRTSAQETATTQYVRYDDVSHPTGGVAILTASDAAKLTGASDKLKAYFVAALPNDTCTPGDGLCPASGIYVKNTVASTYGDFAVVSVPDAFAVLGPDPTTGKIVQIFGGQQSPMCLQMKQYVTTYKIPSAFYSKDSIFTCYPSETSTSAIPYATYKG